MWVGDEAFMGALRCTNGAPDLGEGLTKGIWGYHGALKLLDWVHHDSNRMSPKSWGARRTSRWIPALPCTLSSYRGMSQRQSANLGRCHLWGTCLWLWSSCTCPRWNAPALPPSELTCANPRKKSWLLVRPRVGSVCSAPFFFTQFW